MKSPKLFLKESLSIINRPNIHIKSLLIEDFLKTNILENSKYSDPLHLNRFEYKSFSQYGEDGIIEEIFNRIGTTNKYFIEFGVETGIECNSTLLLYKGWSGLWIEGNKKAVNIMNQNFKGVIGDKRLTIINNFITAENIESLFNSANSPKELDLLSIDIDRNDYYIWQAITNYNPRVVIVEYNAMFPPSTEFVIPYDGRKVWDRTSNFGASLLSLQKLALSKGYSLVACSFSGANAFFVRNDCLHEKFINVNNVEKIHQPARYFLYTTEGHPRNVQM